MLNSFHNVMSRPPDVTYWSYKYHHSYSIWSRKALPLSNPKETSRWPKVMFPRVKVKKMKGIQNSSRVKKTREQLNATSDGDTSNDSTRKNIR